MENLLGLLDNLRSFLSRNTTPATSLDRLIEATIQKGAPELRLHAEALRDRINNNAQSQSMGGFLTTMMNNAGRTAIVSQGGVVGINDYGVKGRRQYAAERRRLLDLYVIVLNNADIRTATFHLRNEIFRRGLELHPAFEFKCRECNTEYTTQQAREQHYRCTECESQERLDVPDTAQIRYFEKLSQRCNYFNQGLEHLLRECEDDVNIVDDAFIYLRKEYSLDEDTYFYARENPFDEDYEPEETLKQIFRLDPTLVEFDLDARGIPGLAHHACKFHRDVLLDVPFDEGWDIRWKGICPQCSLRTYPIYYKYSEQQAGSFGARRPEVLYLFDEEVIHWSRYSPTETYGMSPVLSFYEKALTLIGMDRYLYDYFYERKVPQGIIAVYTDDKDSMERERADVESKMRQDPHYVPWMTVSTKNQQGKIEYVRFGYTLDELDYLPVRDEIRERIAAVYGVSQIWMASSEGIGGLNNESVPGDTPVWIRRDGKFVDCVPIAWLYRGSGRHRSFEALTPNGWSKITNVFRHSTKSPMFTIRAGDALLRVTGNHSVVVNNEIVAADQIHKHDRLSLIFPDATNTTTLTEDLAWVLGFFAAEGEVSSSHVGFSNTDPALIATLCEKLERCFGIVPKIWSYKQLENTTYKDIHTVQIQKKTVADWFAENATSQFTVDNAVWVKGEGRTERHDTRTTLKKVPHLVLNASKDLMQIYVNAYVAGDGHLFANGTVRQETVDFPLAAGIHYLYSILDIPTRTDFIDNTAEHPTWHPIYGINTLLGDKAKRQSPRRIQRDEVANIYCDTQWKDFVYDLEVEDESHLFVGGIGGVVLHNSQQLVVMSRAVEGAQRSYHTNVFPKMEKSLHITDWHLRLKTPEETSELTSIQISQAKAEHASVMAGIGFGVEYNSDDDSFAFNGKVASQAEQQSQQQQLAGQNPFGPPAVGGQPQGQQPSLNGSNSKPALPPAH